MVVELMSSRRSRRCCTCTAVFSQTRPYTLHVTAVLWRLGHTFVRSTTQKHGVQHAHSTFHLVITVVELRPPLQQPRRTPLLYGSCLTVQIQCEYRAKYST